MKPFYALLAVLILGVAPAHAGGDDGTTFHVQLVRGSDDATPPAPGAQPIGPKLARHLGAIFKWTHYWELKRDAVVVKAGTSRRVRMSPEREVEVKMLDANQMEIRIYRNGKLTRVQKEPAGRTFAILGGEKEDGHSWFIVVRRDKPVDP